MKIIVGLLLVAVLGAALAAGCSETTSASADSNAGMGGRALPSVSSGGERAEGGTRSSFGSEEGGIGGGPAPDCEGISPLAAPLCYGQNSASCCQNDPIRAECVDGQWSCFGFPPPGCDGDRCFQLFSCGPDLKCNSTREVCRVTAGASSDVGGIGSGGAPGTTDKGALYECIAYPAGCKQSPSCACIQSDGCESCIEDSDGAITEDCSGA